MRLRLLTALQLSRSYHQHHYANISSDPRYEIPRVIATVSHVNLEFSEYSVFNILDKLKPTATGLDGLPVWFIRMAFPWIAGPVRHIFNLSYRTSLVPVQWMRSCITPVPTIAHPVECKDFRPISVTPVLSRVMERFIVRSDLHPVLVHPDLSRLFSDRFAFRPSGSTTAALIYLFHQLTHLLQKYEYVHLISLDLSKAFDSVKHSTLG